MKTVQAVYENGVFRPTGPVDLPEGCEVEFEPKPATHPAELSPRQRRIRELLRQSVDTDDPRLSERHDEHQP